MKDKEKENSLSLLDLVVAIVRNKWIIIGSAVTGMILGLVFAIFTAFILPQDPKVNPLVNVYKPEMKLVILEPNTTYLSKLASNSVISNIISGAPLTNPNVDLMKQLLSGKTVEDKIIEEFNLIERYGLVGSKYPHSATRDMFEKNIGFAAEENSVGGGNIITLSFMDPDAKFADELISRVVEILVSRFREVSMAGILEKKKFVEDRIGVVEKELELAQKKMEEFQKRYGALDISTQAKEQTRIMADLNSEILKSELELQALQEYMGPSEPRVVRLKKEIQAKKELLFSMKTGSSGMTNFIPQSKIPEILNEYANLEADIEVKTKIYGTLIQEYELTKLEEADTTKNLHVIEPSEIPEKKFGPSRIKIMEYLVMILIVFSVLISLIREYWRSSKQDPYEAEKVNIIKENITLIRGKK